MDFDEILNLEDNLYDEGYRQGQADGQRAGQIEGRTLGLENGYKKFVNSGRLQGKAILWANRLPPVSKVGGTSTREQDEEKEKETAPTYHLARLPANARLRKNVRMLYALVEPGTLSTANTDEAVNDFDDRVKRARGKARVVEKMIDELEERRRPSGRAETSG